MSVAFKWYRGLWGFDRVPKSNFPLLLNVLYEVCLGHQKKTRDVVWAPAVGAGCCRCWYHLRGLLRTPKKLVMWSTGCRCWYHLRGLLTTPKKKSPCGMSTGCRCWYHLRGLLTKPKKNLAMWYEHRLSVLVPLTRFAYETKKNLVMWYDHRQPVLEPRTRFAYKTQKYLALWCHHRQSALAPPHMYKVRLWLTTQKNTSRRGASTGGLCWQQGG
jgi:hypothetical protein